MNGSDQEEEYPVDALGNRPGTDARCSHRLAGVLVGASWFAVGQLHAEELGSTPRLSRAAFATGFQKLHEGMAATEVERILGRPDDIRTKYDPGGISWARTREIWATALTGI